jgi:hypothetical protein
MRTRRGLLSAAVIIWLAFRLAGCGGQDLVIGGSLPLTPTVGPGTPSPTACAPVGQSCDNVSVFCCSGTAACDAVTGLCDF